MNAKLLIGAALLAMLGVLGVALLQQPSVSYVPTTPAPQEQTPTPTPAPTPVPVTSGYTMAQVQAHNSASSCWAAINGNVYNLTNWINQHPGGTGPILSLCGTDGTAAFNAQHGGQGRPAQELATFYLGTLAR